MNFPQLPNKVILQIRSKRDYGLRRLERGVNRDLELAARREERGITPGHMAIRNESRVRLDMLLVDLTIAGFRYIGGHSYRKPESNLITNVLEFIRFEQETRQDIPEGLNALISDGFFDNTTVFVNLTPQRRVDCINCIEGNPTTKHLGRRLTLASNATHAYEAYDLEPMPETARTQKEAAQTA